MAGADLDKQPDSVSSVLKVFGILQALGEEREIGITELSQRVMMSKKHRLSLFTDHEITGLCGTGRRV
ncbi:transcriptional regulator KdgR [Klebsiella pneumoniae]|nr:transcriptional regulator KdgR [Klebsiella pneumoniae]STW68894.1 transcriptional regulator KdgR [Klebsiella pneumoniae]